MLILVCIIWNFIDLLLILYRKISIDAFNFHIKKLILNGILERGRDQGRGSIIYYSLTDKAKQQQRLKILTVKPKKERILFEKELEEERRVKLYLPSVCSVS